MSAASTTARPYWRNAPSSNGSRSSSSAASSHDRASSGPGSKRGNYATRRDPAVGRPAASRAPTERASAGQKSVPPVRRSQSRAQGDRPEPKILFQNYFKSVGPRTYAAQLKEASNGNHFLVLTEGKRDPKTGEVKKISLYVYSEDFVEYFKLIKSAAEFIKAHPVSDEVKRRQAAYWKRQPKADPKGRTK